VIQDRPSRFVVAASSGQPREAVIALALTETAVRSRFQPLTYSCDGWRSYPTLVRQLYQRPEHTGRPGRPRLVVPVGVAVQQTRKVRTPGGRVVRVETHTPLGEPAPSAPTVHIERLNGMLRDRLACLGRKTHAFAKCVGTWRALVGLALCWHHWLRAYPALPTPNTHPGRRYDPQSPAMALGLADQVWTWQAFCRLPVVISR
jgi:hypothetical protein